MPSRNPQRPSSRDPETIVTRERSRRREQPSRGYYPQQREEYHRRSRSRDQSSRGYPEQHEEPRQRSRRSPPKVPQNFSTLRHLPISSRSGILDCISRMTEVKVQVSGEEYTILKCDDNYKLSDYVSKEFPNFVLIRQSTLDIITLFKSKIASPDDIGRFLITGTPGVGKTVSIIVWLYLAWKGELMPHIFKHIIADLISGCILLAQNDAGTWDAQKCDRGYFSTHTFENPKEVLYLYDATYRKDPCILPYRSVVFTSPNLAHCKEFLKIQIDLRMIYYTPVWDWDEVEAFYSASSYLQKKISISDIKRLFEVWGGLPRQIFVPYPSGYKALTAAIEGSNVVTCIRNLERGGSFLSYNDSEEVCSWLMHFDVANDGTYEHAMTNFGSPFIRNGLVEASHKSFTEVYRDFMTSYYGFRDYSAKVRGSLYEKIVLDKLRGLSEEGMNVISFTMEEGKANTALQNITIPQMQQPAEVFSELGDIYGVGRVWTPQQSNFNSFDVLIAPPPKSADWGQITVGKTHPLHVGGVNDCYEWCKTLEVDFSIVFILPPDIFMYWHEHNSVQNFVTKTGTKAVSYLRNFKQTVLCIPSDAMEEEMVKNINIL